MKHVLIVKISAILLVLSCAAIPFSASAQSWGPRTLPQLKAEAQRRADHLGWRGHAMSWHISPMFGNSWLSKKLRGHF